MKFLIPWVACLASIIAAAVLFSQKQQLSAELAAASAAQAQLAEAQAELAELKKGAENDSGASKGGGDELHRLRNEVRQLRSQSGAAAERAAAAAAAAPALAPEVVLSADAQKLKQEIEELKEQRREVQVDLCSQNMITLEHAINYWAGAFNKKPGDNVLPQNVTPYLKNQEFPLCPSGGNYTLRPLGTPPKCSIHGALVAR